MRYLSPSLALLRGSWIVHGISLLVFLGDHHSFACGSENHPNAMGLGRDREHEEGAKGGEGDCLKVCIRDERRAGFCFEPRLFI